jgi:hypothetical protein
MFNQVIVEYKVVTNNASERELNLLRRVYFDLFYLQPFVNVNNFSARIQNIFPTLGLLNKHCVGYWNCKL